MFGEWILILILQKIMYKLIGFIIIFLHVILVSPLLENKK